MPQFNEGIELELKGNLVIVGGVTRNQGMLWRPGSAAQTKMIATVHVCSLKTYKHKELTKHGQ